MTDFFSSPAEPPQGEDVARAARLESCLRDALTLNGLTLNGLTLNGLTLEAPTAGADTDLSAALRARALGMFDDAVAAEALLEEGLLLEACFPQASFPQASFQQASLQQASLQQASPQGQAALSLKVRQAALRAFDAGVASEGVPSAAVSSVAVPSAGAPLRARRMAPLVGWRAAAVAAVVLLAVGASFLVAGDTELAYAGLELRALALADTAGSVQTSRIEPGYRAAYGRRFTPGEDELLSFRFPGEAMVVVGGGTAVRVSRTTLVSVFQGQASQGRVPESLAAAGVHLLRLESGEAQLATRGHAIPLEIDGIGVLVLESGAAHVAVDAGDGSHAPAVALFARSVARFYRADGSAAVPLVGPTRVLLAKDGIKAFGAPARALFHDLRFFGGALPEATVERAVSARLFRARAHGGVTRRGRQDLRLLRRATTPEDTPEDTPQDTPQGTVGGSLTWNLVWRPEPVVAAAHTLKVALRAPVGTRVTLRQRPAAAGEPASAAPTATVAAVEAAAGREPGVSSVTLKLPDRWFARLAEGRLELRIELPESSGAGTPAAPAPTQVLAWFDGIALVFGPRR